MLDDNQIEKLPESLWHHQHGVQTQPAGNGNKCNSLVMQRETGIRPICQNACSWTTTAIRWLYVTSVWVEIEVSAFIHKRNEIWRFIIYRYKSIQIRTVSIYFILSVSVSVWPHACITAWYYDVMLQINSGDQCDSGHVRSLLCLLFLFLFKSESWILS